MIAEILRKITGRHEIERLVAYLQRQLETREELFQQYAEAKTALAQCQALILELIAEDSE